MVILMKQSEFFRGRNEKLLYSKLMKNGQIRIEEIKSIYSNMTMAEAFINKLIVAEIAKMGAHGILYYTGSDDEEMNMEEITSADKMNLRRARTLKSLIRSSNPLAYENPDRKWRELPKLEKQPLLLLSKESETLQHYFIPGELTCASCEAGIGDYGLLHVDWNPRIREQHSGFYLICFSCLNTFALNQNVFAQDNIFFTRIEKIEDGPENAYPVILSPPGLKKGDPTGGVDIDRTVYSGREGYTFQEGSVQIGKPLHEVMVELEAKDRQLLDVKEGLAMIDDLANPKPQLTETQRLRLEQRKRAENGRLEDVEWFRCEKCDRGEKLDGRNDFSIEQIQRGICSTCEGQRLKQLRQDSERKGLG